MKAFSNPRPHIQKLISLITTSATNFLGIVSLHSDNRQQAIASEWLLAVVRQLYWFWIGHSILCSYMRVHRKHRNSHYKRSCGGCRDTTYPRKWNTVYHFPLQAFELHLNCLVVISLAEHVTQNQIRGSLKITLSLVNNAVSENSNWHFNMYTRPTVQRFSLFSNDS